MAANSGSTLARGGGLLGRLRRAYAHLRHDGRAWMSQRRFVFRTIQALRGLLVLGPLNGAFVAYHRRVHKNEPFVAKDSSLFPDLDPTEALAELRKSGFAAIGTLPRHMVDSIREECPTEVGVVRHGPHLENEYASELAHHPAIVEVARQHLGAEPILWNTQIKWSPATDQLPDYSFHYNIIDYRALQVFVYLTDADQDGGPHMILDGTHRFRSPLKRLRPVLSDEQAERDYADRHRTILGEAGTIFFIDVSAYHKVLKNKHDRLWLRFDYVLQRSLPSASVDI